VLIDYNLSRRTDVYVGYMFSKFNGAEVYPLRADELRRGSRHPHDLLKVLNGAVPGVTKGAGIVNLCAGVGPNMQ